MCLLIARIVLFRLGRENAGPVDGQTRNRGLAPRVRPLAGPDQRPQSLHWITINWLPAKRDGRIWLARRGDNRPIGSQTGIRPVVGQDPPGIRDRYVHAANRRSEDDSARLASGPKHYHPRLVVRLPRQVRPGEEYPFFGVEGMMCVSGGRALIPVREGENHLRRACRGELRVQLDKP